MYKLPCSSDLTVYFDSNNVILLQESEPSVAEALE